MGLNSRLPAVVVLTGVAVAAALLIASSLKYPAILRLPGAGVVIAVTAHLIINLFLGLAGGGLGALIARGARPAPAVA